MNTYLNMTKIALEEKEILYNEFDECTIGVGFTKDDDSHLKFSFHFDEEDEDCEDKCNHLHVSTYIENANMKAIYPQALTLCNNLNQDYLWAKFYVDRDYDIACDTDAILSDESAGEECIELMFRLISIIDEVRPKVRQLIEFGDIAKSSAPVRNYC